MTSDCQQLRAEEEAGRFDLGKPVTDQDIQDFYDSNKSSFFMDDMVTIRHIFIDTHLLTTKDDRDKAAKRADDILKELKAGAVIRGPGDEVLGRHQVQVQGRDVRHALQRSTRSSGSFYGTAFFDPSSS